MYVVAAHHIGLHFYCDIENARRCPACGHLLSKWDEDLTVVPIGKFRKYDVGSSYDLVKIFSRRARTVYEQAGMTGLRFLPLAHPDLFAVVADPVVHYDAVRRGTRFEKKCDVCGLYKYVAGATPAYLMPGSYVPPLGFARTDIEFGSNDENSPLLICGDEAAAIFKAAKLKGLELKKVQE